MGVFETDYGLLYIFSRLRELEEPGMVSSEGVWSEQGLRVFLFMHL